MLRFFEITNCGKGNQFQSSHTDQDSKKHAQSPDNLADLHKQRKVRQDVQRALKSIIKENNSKRITPHGFRHTHCSLLFESGASVKEVQVRLGHTDIKTTMDIYTHVT